jgi:quercetin dioxygenase-like cupin family protein
MSHPDPHAPPDCTPIQIGEVWENPVTGERATILELPPQNPELRVVAELLALVGARVIGEHRHPALVERFTVLEGELTLKRDGQTSTLRQGEDRHYRAECLARLVECERPRRPCPRGGDAR